MSIHYLPLPEMSDEDFDHMESVSLGRTVAKNVHLEIELACEQSWARSLELRLAAIAFRRYRYLAGGIVVGAVVMAALDGSAAQKLDRFLTWCGWVVS